MNTALQHSHSTYYEKSTAHTSRWFRFMSWCKNQEENRFMWLAVTLAGHGCFLTPLTLMAVMLTGNSMFLWALVIGAMGIALVTNLAALPTKLTIPVLFLSILVDLGVILSCIIAPFIFTV